MPLVYSPKWIAGQTKIFSFLSPTICENSCELEHPWNSRIAKKAHQQIRLVPAGRRTDVSSRDWHRVSEMTWSIKSWDLSKLCKKSKLHEATSSLEIAFHLKSQSGDSAVQKRQKHGWSSVSSRQTARRYNYGDKSRLTQCHKSPISLPSSHEWVSDGFFDDYHHLWRTVCLSPAKMIKLLFADRNQDINFD